MLQESPHQRSNIYQVMEQVCLLRGTEIPIPDVYPALPAPPDPHPQIYRDAPDASSIPIPSPILQPADSPTNPVQFLPEVPPMRRGRPAARLPSSSASRGHSERPCVAHDHPQASSGSPLGSTVSPLGSTVSPPPLHSLQPADMAARFAPRPFDLNSGSSFNFADTPSSSNPSPTKNIEALANSSFTVRSPLSTHSVRHSLSQNSNEVTVPVSVGDLFIHSPTPHRPNMISTGTMTSPAVSPASAKLTSSSLDLPNRAASSRNSLPCPPREPTASEDLINFVNSNASRQSVRPASVHIASYMDFLRDLESSPSGIIKADHSRPPSSQATASSRPHSSGSSNADLSQFDKDTRERLEVYRRRVKETTTEKLAPTILQNTVHRLLNKSSSDNDSPQPESQRSSSKPPKPYKPARLMDNVKSSAIPPKTDRRDFEKAFEQRFPSVNSS
ncbi:hypothetical protein NEOLI_003237 [Neolecta irregularis DAH-3]|uniref:Uncharacterized protein n=1 Tax=Neolecta irregularis (strain DAH-3) TaxID=1198029 RepID=A0A1U7LSC5_NEOID|nr:hypothetical protein NEOLI_003237 [Neolecta irregularis DAH-3]|eukprot:OLL25483.1 hypothetical protein NEOLI_003237 [Neolecta irregularis DAH-3]